MPYYEDIADSSRMPALRFVDRVYRMRMLGTVLCAIPIAAVLQETGAPFWTWVTMVLNALVWPQVARVLAHRARDPAAVEYRNLLIDAAMGGMWIAIISVNLLPSAVMVTILCADRFAAGGWRLLLRALPALLAGFVLTWWLLGQPFAPATSLRTMIACVPLLFGYQFALSVATRRRGRTIARQNRELERVTRTDAASGIPNRRHFDERAAHAFKLFHRNGRRAALLLIDIDHFKTINDRYGHGMGDVVLRRVGQVLRSIATGDDLPARFGGDEFALLLTPADRERARSIAERVRAEISSLVFEAEAGLSCTVSIGLAETRGTHTALTDWIRDADAALYRAKAAGRNRVEGS